MKIERLLSIIILLLDKQIVSATTLAKKFEVSKRTIYRDIETLEFAGFPIVAQTGKNGGFGLLDTFKMTSFTFSEKEKLKIMEALQLQEQLLSFQETDSIVKGKLQAINNANTKNIALSLSSATLHNPQIEKQTTLKLKELHTALTKQQKIKITYITTFGDHSHRTILPIELLLQNGSWYLKAFCELRKDIRLFKITRIRDFTILDFTFDLKNCPQENPKEPKTITIQLLFTKQTLGKLYDFFLEKQMTITEESVLVCFPYQVNNNIIPFLLMFGNQVQVIEPTVVKENHIQAIHQMQNIY